MAERIRVLTTFQAADYCQVSPFTIRNWIESGALPAYKTPGGHRRIRKDDLDEFLKKHKMPGPEASAEGKKKILVVDDDQTVTGFVSKVISQVDDRAEVAVALDGFEAGSLIVSFQPQVVILDIRMPGLDGFQVCNKIRSNPRTSNATIIGITGYYSPEYAERFGQCGGWQLLKKPLDVERLKNVIREALQIQFGAGSRS